jgi:hypothetical protein
MDLSDPAYPLFIRDFGLVGQEPGSVGPVRRHCMDRSRSVQAPIVSSHHGLTRKESGS